MISIIVPIYKSEKYIDRCIKSIIDQSYEEFELLLIDDGSPDNSSIICESWAKKDKRVRFLKKENGGVSSARNLGLTEAKGDYITFVDSDDWVESEYLATLIHDIDSENVDIACCNFACASDVITKSTEKVFLNKKLPRDEALDCYSEYYFTSVWAKLFKKDILLGLYFDEGFKYSEDTLFYTEAVLRSSYIYWNNSALYNYFENDCGAMKTFDFDSGITDFYARKKIVQIFEELHCNSELVTKATCRAVSSAVAILWKAKKDGLADKRMVELRKYIRINKKYYFCNSKISLKNKLALVLCAL